jgi:urease accessory protein
MPADPKLLILTQWLSPAYPTGAFAWSHGLEAAIHAGWVRDAHSLQDWLEDLLTDGTGRSDAIFIALAECCGSPKALHRLDQTARAFCASSERVTESDRQGAAFARVTRRVWDLDLPDCLLPVALGRAAHLMALPVPEVTALYLQNFASNLIAAAQRMMPLGQTDAQAVLARLTPLCASVAADAETVSEDDLYSNCFLSDIAAMRHETQDPRLFQS